MLNHNFFISIVENIMLKKYSVFLERLNFVGLSIVIVKNKTCKKILIVDFRF